MKKRQKRNTVTTVILVIVFTVLIIYSLSVILSLLWGVLTSLKSWYDFEGRIPGAGKNYLGFPNLDKSLVSPNGKLIMHSRREFFELFNYQTVVKNFKMSKTTEYYASGSLAKISHSTKVWFGNAENGATFIDILLNTLLYTIGGAGIMCFMPALTAYITAKYDYVWCKALHIINIVIMCIPIVGRYPTELTFLRNSGLYDTMLGNYVQKMTGGGTYYLVYYAFFKGLSDVYRDAASIDGASEFAITFRIYFPLAQKMILTVFLIQFVNLWNDYQTLYLYLPSYPTLAYSVFYLVIESSNSQLKTIPMTMAACMLLAVPILILFIIFKDKLMGSISLGGIKE